MCGPFSDNYTLQSERTTGHWGRGAAYPFPRAILSGAIAVTASGCCTAHRLPVGSRTHHRSSVIRLTDVAPEARGRKQCQMTNVGGGDHGFITIANQNTGLRDEDHAGRWK